MQNEISERGAKHKKGKHIYVEGNMYLLVDAEKTRLAHAVKH